MLMNSAKVLSQVILLVRGEYHQVRHVGGKLLVLFAFTADFPITQIVLVASWWS